MKNDDALNRSIDDMYRNGELVVRAEGWFAYDAYYDLVRAGVNNIGELQRMSWNEFRLRFDDKDTRQMLCDYIHRNGGRMAWDAEGRKPSVYPYIEPSGEKP